MAMNTNRVFYRETVLCPLSILAAVALAATLGMVLLVLVMAGIPNLDRETFGLSAALLAAVFAVSLVYGRLRYRVKIKVFRGMVDDRVFLSLRGVGKGTWRQIPLESIAACRPCAYRSPLSGLLALFVSGNAPFKTKNGAISVYPLPGYTGSGICITYQGLGSTAGSAELSLPTRHPAALQKALMGPKDRSGQHATTFESKGIDEDDHMA